MTYTDTPSFEIETTIDGIKKKVQVKVEETTDGVPYYVCSVSGEQISEIRRENDNTWSQLWGDLNEETVKSIGKEIEKFIH